MCVLCAAAAPDGMSECVRYFFFFCVWEGRQRVPPPCWTGPDNTIEVFRIRVNKCFFFLLFSETERKKYIWRWTGRRAQMWNRLQIIHIMFSLCSLAGGALPRSMRQRDMFQFFHMITSEPYVKWNLLGRRAWKWMGTVRRRNQNTFTDPIDLIWLERKQHSIDEITNSPKIGRPSQSLGIFSTTARTQTHIFRN